jgi:leader peptidase (prepilin peptidase)/N-methyltransferase
MSLFAYIVFFVFGAAAGSFMNVCIYRIPRGQSIIMPPSRCPSCGEPILPWDNIPVMSFLLLGGRCRACRGKISMRYPAVEALNGILYALVLWRFGLGWHTPFYLLFVSAMAVITFIDLDFQIIPDGITLPGTALGLILGSTILNDPFLRINHLGFLSSVIGAATGFGLYYLIATASRGGMGGGDIKMMSMVGAFLGWKAVLLTTFAGSLMGSIAGVFLMAFKGMGRKSKIPFGPFLAAGALITLFFGQEILVWYQHEWH